jgi:uncharacterized membrane protein YgdD (TMEM256/DUF423 family)
MNRNILIVAGFFGMLAVVFGAFGAHGLKAVLTDAQLTSYETGVRYQMYHALLLLWVGLYNFKSIKRQKIVFYLVLLGVIFFSGSIYGLATTTLTGINFKAVAWITPVGGLLLILAWLLLIVDFMSKKTNKS